MRRKLSVCSCLDGMSNINPASQSFSLCVNIYIYIYIYLFVNDSGKDSIHEERYTDDFRDDLQQFES